MRRRTRPVCTRAPSEQIAKCVTLADAKEKDLVVVREAGAPVFQKWSTAE